MFWLVRLVVVLALVALLIVGVGYLLPDKHVTKMTTMIDAAQTTVYRIVTDVENQRNWRNDVRSVQVLSRDDLWTWTMENADGVKFRFQEKVKQPNERYELDLETAEGGRGEWSVELEPVGEARTKLTCTQTVVVRNPVRRVVSYLLINNEEQINAYLRDLSREATKK